MARSQLSHERENGLVALVTGTSSGIGRAAAIALQDAGFTTVATARRLADIDDLRARGCRTAQLDVTDEASMVGAVDEITRQLGAVYLLVNNAGYGQYGPIEEIPLEAVRRQFEVNLFGAIRLCQLVLPGMRQLGHGRIINISSIAGEIDQPGAAIYHATKHALEAINNTLRMETSAFGIDVISIQPGPVATRFADTAIAAIPQTVGDSPYHVFKQNLVKTTRRMMSPEQMGVLKPEEVAAVIVEAATAGTPDTRYHVGLPSKLMSALYDLSPDRVWDAAMTRLVPVEKSH